jgi:hypothetical protein
MHRRALTGRTELIPFDEEGVAHAAAVDGTEASKGTASENLG